MFKELDCNFFVVILEPQNICDPSSLDHNLGLTFSVANENQKSWIFSHRDFVVDMVMNSDQIPHVRVSATVLRQPIFITAVYAKCSRALRYPLWESLRKILHGWWDVTLIFFLHDHERIGSSADRHMEMADFADALADCQLIDPGFDCPLFTWERSGLRQRLDIILLGEQWSNAFASSRVTHLPRISSDHGALLVRCNFSNNVIRTSFRFQNMWVRHHSFLDDIARIWEPLSGFSGMLSSV